MKSSSCSSSSSSSTRSSPSMTSSTCSSRWTSCPSKSSTTILPHHKYRPYRKILLGGTLLASYEMVTLFLHVHANEDTNKHCGHWASQGECATRPKYMWKNCPASCAREAPDTKPTEAGEGSIGKESGDKNDHCGAWGAAGECQKRRKFMWLNCRGTCLKVDPGLEPTSTDAPTTEAATTETPTTEAATTEAATTETPTTEAATTEAATTETPTTEAATTEAATTETPTTEAATTEAATTETPTTEAATTETPTTEAPTTEVPTTEAPTTTEPTTTTEATTTTEVTTTTTAEPTTTTTEPTTTTTEATTTTTESTTTTTTTEPTTTKEEPTTATTTETTTTTEEPTTTPTTTEESTTTTTTEEPTTTATTKTEATTTTTTTEEAVTTPAVTTPESTVASTTDTTTSASTGPESSSSTTENPPTEEGGATTSTTPAEVDTTTPAGASTTPAVLLEDEEDDGLILQPAANYAKMERITEEEFIEDMQSHNRTFDEIMAKLQLVETRDSEDLRAEAKKEEAELADEKPRKKGEKAKVGTVKTGKELMESLETVPTVNQMRTKFANIQARAAQFEENSTDTPFGGELDEMVSYSFSSLDHTVVGKGNQNHLLCYAKGVGGVGTCRIVKTFAGRAHNDLVKGNGTEFNVRGIRNLMVKSITKKFFVLCHDSTAAAGCFILEVRESEKQEQSGDMDWPSIVYHNRVGEAFAMGAVSKLLSLIVTRPPVHTELRTTAAEFAVCYKTLGTALGRRKKGSAQYQCDQGTFDDRDPASLKKLLPQEEDTAGGVEQEEGSFSEGDVLEGDVLDVGVVQKEKGRPKEEL